jgi:hypothetical protein
MIHPLSGKEVLDRYFLDLRCKLIEVAAVLDRIDRGGGVSDPRLDKIRQALTTLRESRSEKAEQLQQIFSLPYDSNWQKCTLK